MQKLSDTSEKLLEKAFTEIDVNKNGYVEPEELLPFIKNAGCNVTLDNVKTFINSNETQYDGKLTVEEFKKLMVSLGYK